MSNTIENNEHNADVEVDDDELEGATGGIAMTPQTGHKNPGDGPAPEVFKPFTPSY